MNYEMLIENILQKFNCPIILMEPFIFPYPAEYLTWAAEVHKMAKIIKEISKKYQLHFLAVSDNLKDRSLTTDGIHLTQEGHTILADLWLNFAKNIKII